MKGCMRVMCTWGFSYELEDEKVVNFGKRRAHKHTIHIPYIVLVDRSFFFTAATHSYPRRIASSTQITIYSNCIFSHSSYTTWHLHLHLHKRHEPPITRYYNRIGASLCNMHVSIDFKLYTLNVLIYSNDLDRSTFSSPASLNDMLNVWCIPETGFLYDCISYHANKSKSTRGMRKKEIHPSPSCTPLPYTSSKVHVHIVVIRDDHGNMRMMAFAFGCFIY